MNSKVTFRKKVPVRQPAKSSKRVTRDIVNGHSFIPSDDPPVINASPWCNIILTTDFKVAANAYTYFKVVDLSRILSNQAGFKDLDNKFGFEFRVQSLAVWATGQVSTDDYVRFALFPMNLMGSNTVELLRLDSNSVKNKFARVGYSYPSAHQSAVFSTNGDNMTLFSCISSKATTVFLHYKVLWRGASQGFKVTFPITRYLAFDPPSFQQPAEEEQASCAASAASDLAFDRLSIRDFDGV